MLPALFTLLIERQAVHLWHSDVILMKMQLCICGVCPLIKAGGSSGDVPCARRSFTLVPFLTAPSTLILPIHWSIFHSPVLSGGPSPCAGVRLTQAHRQPMACRRRVHLGRSPLPSCSFTACAANRRQTPHSQDYHCAGSMLQYAEGRARQAGSLIAGRGSRG